MPDKPASVEDYLAAFPDPERAILQRIRDTVHEALPGAGETISYDMPAITLGDRPVLSFAGWKQHVSIYPIPEGDEAFEADIAPYKAGRGTLKFPLGQPIPYDLIARIAVRLAERKR
ncbi:iron chaperone [Nocardia thailandica]|uniref:Iron chaperone n=1 Tax=Nocardia thailandica TaxID=257275 RepID=A0ABW6PI30_9NOCA|nr:DUF1801 domain-containing protein [Nocardia thailandica]